MKLTEEQKDILEELISGSTNQQIADKTGYCERSIKRKIKHLFNTFNVKNRSSLVREAIIAKSNGII
jgi:DNA-binding NarL/FixJ family response regulator